MPFQAQLSSTRARSEMCEVQLRDRGIQDERVLAAMGAVPRELFVLPTHQGAAYADSAMTIGHGQTISQPYMVARTCELAAISPGHRVLEVGGGSGYQAAVLGKLGHHVVAIERVAELAERARQSLARAGINNVEVVVGDGSVGYAERAPYDRILVSAAAPEVPAALTEQLSPRGRLVVPVGTLESQVVRVVDKHADGTLHAVDYDPCRYVPLLGDQGFTA